MLLCEEFLMLVTSAQGRWLGNRQAVPLALAGALLAELVQYERLTVDDRGRIAVAFAAPLGEPMLDDAFARFAAKAGKQPKDVLGKVARGLDAQLRHRLIRTGVIEVRRGRLLPTRRYPLRDLAPRQRTWNDLAAVLAGHRPPDARTATLLGLMVASDALTQVFPPEQFGMSKRQLVGYARTLAESAWATDAVTRAVRQVQAATYMMIMAATTAAGSH